MVVEADVAIEEIRSASILEARRMWLLERHTHYKESTPPYGPQHLQRVGQNDNMTDCPRGHGKLIMDGEVRVCVICGFESFHGTMTNPGAPVGRNSVGRERGCKGVRYSEQMKVDAAQRYNAGESAIAIMVDVGCSRPSLRDWARKYDPNGLIRAAKRPWGNTYPESLKVAAVREYGNGVPWLVLLSNYRCNPITLQSWIEKYGNGKCKV